MVLLVSSGKKDAVATDMLPTDDSRVAWLRQHAIPLQSIDPQNDDFSDLEPLRRVLRDVRIVQLGEATHGDGATFHAKTRLIRFLHKELGFDVLAFESGLYDCRKAWQLLLDGMEPHEAFRHGVFGIWAGSEQVGPLIDYWGQAAKGERPLELCGFDCQFTARASRDGLLIADVESLLNTLDSTTFNEQQRATILETLATLPKLFQTRGDHNPHDIKALYDGLSIWQALIERAEPSDSLPEDELSFWRQFLTSTSTLVRMIDKEEPGYGNLRDEQMAHNLLWLAQKAYPRRKIIVWAASSHLVHNPVSPFYQTVTMGNEVRKVLGEQTYTYLF